MTKIAINGFGRIGRLAFRQIFEDETMEVTAIKQAFFNIRSRESMEEVNAFVEAGNGARGVFFVSVAGEYEIKRVYCGL